MVRCGGVLHQKLGKRPHTKPYNAKVRRDGKRVNVGSFATADRGGGAVRRAIRPPRCSLGMANKASLAFGVFW